MNVSIDVINEAMQVAAMFGAILGFGFGAIFGAMWLSRPEKEFTHDGN